MGEPPKDKSGNYENAKIGHIRFGSEGSLSPHPLTFSLDVPFPLCALHLPLSCHFRYLHTNIFPHFLVAYFAAARGWLPFKGNFAADYGR